MGLKEKDTSNKTADPRELRDYLLGKLKGDAVLERIETRLMTEPAQSTEIEGFENALIEEYLDGEMSSEDSEAFIRHFLASPEHRRQLTLVRDLRRFASKAEAPGKAKTGLFGWVPQMSFAWVRFAAITAVTIVAGLFIWRVVIYQSDADKSVAQLRQAYRGQRPIEPRITALPDYVPYSETRGPAPNVTDADALRRAEVYLLEPSQDPANAKAQQAYANLALAQRHYDDALRHFELALKAAPNDASIQNDAGAAYLQLARNAKSDKDATKFFENLDQSLKYLDRAITLAPKMPEPRYNKALCLELSNMRDQAKAAWNEYLTVDQTSKWADDARSHLQALNSNSTTERSADELERDYLDAIRRSDQTQAARLIAENRELITDKYLPFRLAMSYVNADEKNAGELLRGLASTGELELKQTGDPFARNIARFYQAVPAEKRSVLKQAHAAVRSGYGECLITKHFGDAAAYFRQAVALFESVGDGAEGAIARYMLGYALTNEHETSESTEIFTKTDAYASDHGYLWLQATVDYWLAGSAIRAKHVSLAKERYSKALSIADRIDDGYTRQRHTLELARLSAFADEKKPTFDQYLRIIDDPQLWTVGSRQLYRNLSVGNEIFSRARLYNISTMLGRNAVIAADKQRDQQLRRDDEMFQSESRSKLGSTLVENGKLDEAANLFSEADKFAGQIEDNKQREVFKALVSLGRGELDLKSGNFEASASEFAAAKSFYDVTPLSYFAEDANRGRLLALLRLGRSEELEKQIADSVSLTESFRSSISDAGERSSYFDSRENAFDVAAEFEQGRGNIERAYDYAEASNARSLLDWLSKGLASDTAASRPASSLLDHRPLRLSEIRERLPQNVQIIQFAVLEDKTLIWVVSRDTFDCRESNTTASELDAKVESYLSLVSTRGSDRAAVTLLGRDLYDTVISPVKGGLDTQKELVIVPSKVLFKLPFQALYAGEGRPMIQDFSIVYAPSASVYLECTRIAAAKTSGKNEAFLGISNPVIDESRFPGLTRLVGTGDEVRAIAADYDAGTVLDSADVTKSAVLRNLARADIVHIAGHYIVMPGSPALSYLPLTKDASDADDGVLTNRELQDNVKTNAKLIVLAACQTGVQSFSNGEGMTGLSRTFLEAGIPSVVASQWAVDTEATSVLMRRFHQLRRSGKMPTAGALRTAEIEMLNEQGGKFNDPYYWAAFAMFGGHSEG